MMNDRMSRVGKMKWLLRLVTRAREVVVNEVTEGLL
jgi:hypothetical protein